MRISLFGNVLNLSFLLGMLLRRQGHEVRLFTDERGAVQDRPEWECADEGEAAALPLVPVDVNIKGLLLGGRAERRFRAELADADVVQTFGEGVVWTAGCGAPDTVLSIGDDLDIIPFRKDGLRIRIYSAVLRRAQRRCSAVCYTMPPQEASCRDLGLTNARFLPCAIPVDYERWTPLSCTERAAARHQLGLPHDAFVVFQPSRQEWRCPETPGSNHKANDRLLRAFGRFVQGPGRDAVLLAVTKGRDVAASQALATQLGLNGRVHWIPPQDKRALRRCLGASDVVADQFTYGFYGMSSLEAMAVGRPVLLHLDTLLTKRAGLEPPPIVSVRSEDEIHHALCDLAQNRVAARELGEAARSWVVRHHGWETVVERYLKLYRGLSSGE